MKKFLNNKVVKEIINIFMIAFGTFLMGFAFNSFFYANSIAPSDFSGLAAVISDSLVKLGWFYISPTILYLIFNIGLIILAFFTLGKKYVLYSILGIGFYSLFIQFLKIDIGVNDLFLSAVFGAVILGVGIGIVVRFGGSTGGGEMLGNILHYYNPKITVGKFIIFVDICVLLLSFFAYGIINSLYTLIAIYIGGVVVDKVIDGGKETRAFYIISNKQEEIKNAILNNLSRGATLIKAKGLYSNEDKNILLCLVNKYQVSKLKDIIFEIDDSAFTFNTKVNEAYGQGFDESLHFKRIKKLQREINKNKKKEEKNKSNCSNLENLEYENSKNTENTGNIEKTTEHIEHTEHTGNENLNNNIIDNLDGNLESNLDGNFKKQ